MKRLQPYLFAALLTLCGTLSAQTIGRAAGRAEANPEAEKAAPASAENAQSEGMSADEINDIKKKSESGNAEAQLALGSFYADGLNGFAADPQKAVFWITKAAEQNLTAAQHMLGYIYGEGRMVERDYDKAVHWRELAAEQGSAGDKWALGNAFLYGFFLPKDQNKALYWITKSAEGGNMDAILKLVEIYGNFGDKEQVSHWESALAKTELAEAEKGNVYAMAEVAKKYMAGKGGLPQNRSQGIYWYKLAADNGNFQAMEFVGKLYAKGRFLPKNPEMADAYFNKLAEADPRFCVGISEFYAKDDGFGSDMQKANEWYERWVASDMADVITRISWAWKYWAGSGMPQNNEKAVYWCEQAIKANDAMPMSIIKSDDIRRMIKEISDGRPATPELPEYLTEGVRRQGN